MSQTKTTHKIGLLGLTTIGIGTMIGSGWLFSSYYAAKLAGPASFLAWLLTSLLILILGLCLSEIASTYPRRGLMARLLVISHSKEFAFVCTITTWLGLTAVIATEAEGSVQYLSSLSIWLKPYLFNEHLHHLTLIGMASAIFLVILFGVINFWGVKVMSMSNNVLTLVKVVIPLLTAVSIMAAVFHHTNFTSFHHSFIPYGSSSIFIAMLGAGMIYSFNGFQNMVSFSSEVKNPQRNIPLAMVFSILITLMVYLTLESAFIGSLSPATLVKGWGSLNFTSPFVQITTLLNLNFITIVLYIDSVASPSGTGMIYTGSTTRMLTGMAKDKQMPAFFLKKNLLYNFSRRSLATTIGLAIIFLLLFRSWVSLVSFLSLFYVISYMSIPICLGKLRQHDIIGTFSVPGASFFCPILFVILSGLYIVSGPPYTVYVTGFVFIAFIIYGFIQHSAYGNSVKILRQSSTLLLHIIALSCLSLIGPTQLGGNNFLGYHLFILILILVALTTYFISVFYFNKRPSPAVPRTSRKKNVRR